jgi:nitrite reductase (NADH) large subunit
MKTNKKNLVVIGNGMAGARTVEEILARGGADQFQITMFGEEPAGNYNRILLSNVLNGSYSEDDIFLNPLAWYEENNIRLLSGKRASGLLRRAGVIFIRAGPKDAVGVADAIPGDASVVGIAAGSCPA